MNAINLIAQAISGGIVHCVGDPCTLCDLWILGDRLTRFLLFNVMLPIAALMILIAGVMLLTARDNQQQQTQGKQVLWYAVWGMIIAFAAWLIVSTLLATLGYKGTWYEFPSSDSCVAATGTNGGNNGGDGNNSNCTDGGDGYPKSACENQFAEPPEGTSIDLNEKNGLCVSTSQFNQFINEASEIYGVPAARIKAIIMAESAGDPLAAERDNDGTGSYGLMQIRPDTARILDPDLPDNDSDVIAQLKDPRYNINQGTRYYKQLKDKYGNDNFASAAYNGGPVANYSSVNCASEGKKRWQCEWDNNEHTLPNSRSDHPGYGPTRAYVPKVANLESQVAAGACE